LLTFGWHRDWLVCLGQEWHIIWKAKWSLVKVLYLIARYWSLFAMSFSLWSFTANFSYSECEKVVHWIVRIPSCVSNLARTDFVLPLSLRLLASTPSNPQRPV
jgi:hypothetical protein